MSFRRLSPREAHALVTEQGYTLIDVRTVPEFEAGHPDGAVNIPISHATATGMAPNPQFVDAVAASFPKDAKLVVACKAGGRSMKAATALVAAGFTDVVDQRAGFSGATDPYGRVAEAGWAAEGLPVATGAPAGRTWADVAAKLNG